MANTWRVVDYVLVALPIVMSIAVIYVETVVAESWHKKIAVVILSALAAILSLLSFAIEPQKHMRNYRKAFFEGYKTLIRNMANSGVDKAYENSLINGEKIIGTTYDIEEYQALEDQNNNSNL